jgi:hypothetical protein
MVPGQQRAAGQRLEFGEILGGKFTATEIKNGVAWHLETHNRQGAFVRGFDF